MIGKSIENYKILEKLKATETFEVYKAIDTLLERNVYIKALGREFMNKPLIADNFRSEAATLAKLAHPCVPMLHSLMAMDGRLFMIMEFLEGETLNGKKLSAEKGVEIFVQILDCIEHAHNAGIAHGGLETSDIILVDEEQPKIFGFGKSESFQTGKNKDIHAVGRMIYETLTGETFVEGQIEETKRRLYAVNPAIPQTVTDAITKALFQKFQTAAEFREALIRTETDDSVNVKFEEKKSATDYSVSFATDNKKFKKKLFVKKSSKVNEGGKSKVRPKQASYIFAGSAICAIIIFHLVFQFSFIQSENVKLVQELSKNEQPAETFTKPVVENNDVPDINDVEETEQAEQTETKIDYKKPVVITKPKESAPRVQTQPKPARSRNVIKKSAPQESRAERLRRAEKILTGV